MPLFRLMFRWLGRLFGFLSWTVLVLGLLLGMAWGTLHLWIVPRIQEFRPDLEQWASRAVGAPVHIGQLRVLSNGWVPSFELQNIAVRDAQGRTALTLPKVWVAVSVRSLLRLQLEQLALDHPDLDVRLNASGQWTVAGLAMGNNDGQPSAAADWLFSQKEVVVRGGTLRWTHEKSAPALNGTPATLVLTDVDLVIRNALRTHKLRLDATPPAHWGKRFTLMAQMNSPLLSTHPGLMQSWSGQVFAEFPHVDAAQLRPHVNPGLDVQQGQGRLRLWSDLSQGQWRGASADVQLQGLRLQLGADLPVLAFDHIGGLISGTYSAEGFSLSTRQLSFDTPDQQKWRGGDVSVRYTHAHQTHAAQGQLQGKQLDLATLRQLALKLPLPADWKQELERTHAQGVVQELDAQWQGTWPQLKQYSVKAQAVGLGWNAQAQPVLRPGMEGAQLALNFNQDGGEAKLSMPGGGLLDVPGWLQEPLVTLQELQAQAQWKVRQGQIELPQWTVKLRNADVQAQASGSWNPGPGPMGTLDLKGTIAQAEAQRVAHYLPASLPTDVRQYVEQGIRGGRVSNVQVRIKGPLDKLPFETAKDGDFRFAGQVQHLALDYMPPVVRNANMRAWPTLHEMNGELVFDRLGMQFKGKSALAGTGTQALKFSDIDVRIPNMHERPQLYVSAKAKGGAQATLQAMRNTALDDLLEGALHNAQASGTIQGDFALDLPLHGDGRERLQGQIQLQGNDVRMAAYLPALQKAKGSVTFSHEGFSLRQLQGQLLGGLVRMEGGMKTEGKQPVLNIRMQGQVSAAGLQAARELAPLNVLARRMTGSSAYSAELGWREGLPVLEVRSQLQGLALDLPAPLNKTASQTMALAISSQALKGSGGTHDQVLLALGPVVSAHYVRQVSDGTPRVVRGSLGLGVSKAQAPALPEQGVAGAFAFDTLDTEAWLSLLQTPPGNEGGLPEASMGYLPTHTSLRARTLRVEDRDIHDLQVTATREGGLWSANVDARELNGQLQYRAAQGTQAARVFARLSRLDLPAANNASSDSLLQSPPSSMPALDIVIQKMRLRGKDLGQVEIQAINREVQGNDRSAVREWQLNTFNITLPEARLLASGRWQPGQRTSLDFKLESKDSGALLTRLGTPDALRDGPGLLAGRISWQGSPMQPHYPSMDGQFNIALGRGQFLKADPGAAKLLGVLSLQALPRRFLLDFRDVFYQGFVFDTVRGDVTIQRGIAQTRNLQIQGVNALLQMDGSADIAQETQRLRVLVLPELDAGTASLVAGIAVNPVVGLTSFLAQLFLQNPLAKATSQEFLIEGAWSDPVVTKVQAAPAGSTPASPSR
ncbi:MAG: hypothetical protein RLZ63_845 [Pseudomonadota bacterium]